MSRTRQVFVGAFFATAIGVVNGINVFGPILEEQHGKKLNETLKTSEVGQPGTEKTVEGIGAVEAESERRLTINTISKTEPTSDSWWARVNPWSSLGASASPLVINEDKAPKDQGQQQLRETAPTNVEKK